MERRSRSGLVPPVGDEGRLLVESGFAGRCSPDGRQIEFIRGKWPSSEVYLIAADGSNPRSLTPIADPPKARERP